jgi:dihydroxyacid dehydratase/phosphogluconate dehydratase
MSIWQMILVQKLLTYVTLHLQDTHYNEESNEVGGNIALVKERAIIKIDIDAITINFEVSDEELKKKGRLEARAA